MMNIPMNWEYINMYNLSSLDKAYSLLQNIFIFVSKVNYLHNICVEQGICKENKSKVLALKRLNINNSN